MDSAKFAQIKIVWDNKSNVQRVIDNSNNLLINQCLEHLKWLIDNLEEAEINKLAERMLRKEAEKELDRLQAELDKAECYTCWHWRNNHCCANESFTYPDKSCHESWQKECEAAESRYDALCETIRRQAVGIAYCCTCVGVSDELAQNNDTRTRREFIRYVDEHGNTVGGCVAFDKRFDKPESEADDE